MRLRLLLLPLLLLAAAPAQAAKRFEGQDEFQIVATWSYPAKLQLAFVDWTMVPQPWAALNGKLRAWCYKAGEQFEYAGTAALKPKQKQAVVSLKKEPIPDTPWLAPVSVWSSPQLFSSGRRCPSLQRRTPPARAGWAATPRSNSLTSTHRSS